VHVKKRYDAIIVGARVAGAATGLLLARAGARALIVDRDIQIGDTLSTHALMRPAVELLSHWGLLDRLLDAGTPIARQAQFQYGQDRVTVAVRRNGAVPGLCAPRRRLLDRIILDAAEAAGAALLLGNSIEECLFDATGRVIGASIRRRDGTLLSVHADLVIGADGRASRVAELVSARLLTSSLHRAGTIYGYFPGIPNRGYRWFFGNGVAGGVIPTNDGLHCVFASCRPEDFKSRFATEALGGLRVVFGRFDPDLADCTHAPAEPLRRYPGAPGHVRARAGRGWALVGDAAFFKDPATAHGITDALLDAHHLAGLFDREGGLERYQLNRNAHAVRLFETTQTIASFDWDYDSLKSLHATLNDCLKREQPTFAHSAPGPTEAPAVKPAARPLMSGDGPSPRRGRWSSALRSTLSDSHCATRSLHAPGNAAKQPSSRKVGE
jgi:2-polyprenyl-6-methoxyphenol hydroxylase-like FAD-dependent oxidoreductase